MVWKIRVEPVVVATLFYGFSGVAFVLANILFARKLAPVDYGTLSLVLALIQMSVPLAPLGIDGAINRHQMVPTLCTLRRALGVATVLAALVVVTSIIIYGIGGLLIGWIFLAIIAGAGNVVVAAYYQSLQQFTRSLFISQCSSLILVSTAPLLLRQQPVASWMCLYLLVGYLISAFFGWRSLARKAVTNETLPPNFWSDSLAIAGNKGAGLVLSQLERLLIPPLLGMEQLAHFGVLATLIGSPYHILHLGIGQTLLPRLRSCNSVIERRALIRKEAAMISIFAVITAPVLVRFTPLALKVLIKDRYSLSGELIAFALAAGLLKVLSAFVTASATALTGHRSLRWLAVCSWGSIGIALLTSKYLAHFGLAGILACVGIAWLFRVLSTIPLMLPHLRAQKMS